ncbi:MAG: hypothetical protein IKZ59_02210 [Clostridia bacterium]|nr:hypothetical protein [Clostridia bacterium]
MDAFCEQLVPIKKGAKFYLGTFGLWFVVLLIFLFSFLYPPLMTLSLILTAAAGYGAYYLMGFLSKEYEYIITDDILDIDIIYSKRSRKRIASLKLSEVESIEKYNGAELDKKRYKGIYIACNTDFKDAYKFVFSGDSGLRVAVLEPNEKTRREMLKSIPRFVGNTAFK